MKNNYDIFKILPPNLNDKLSMLSKSDILDIKKFLNKYYLELRNKIDSDNNITFGLEFEFEDAHLSRIEEELINLNLGEDWTLKEELTVDSGAEVTTPILTDNNTTWLNIQKICTMLSKHSKILYSAGAHVHIGAQIFEGSKENILNFALLWTTYENVIYRFLYGEYLNKRLTLPKYAASVSRRWCDDYFVLSKMEGFSNNAIIKWFNNGGQWCVINLSNIVSLTERLDLNTIEFRGGNGTLNAIIWQNYVNLYIKMINYCKNKDFKRELIIDRLYTIKDNLSKLDSYNNIYIDQALEFCDLIFDNNLDKIYFLRQYLKDMRVVNDHMPVKSKQFTIK